MLLEVGRITKPHGVRGDVLVALSSDRTSRLDPGSVLETDRGSLTVESSSRHQDRWIVSFREIAGRDALFGRPLHPYSHTAWLRRIAASIWFSRDS